MVFVILSRKEYIFILRILEHISRKLGKIGTIFRKTLIYLQAYLLSSYQHIIIYTAFYTKPLNHNLHLRTFIMLLLTELSKMIFFFRFVDGSLRGFGKKHLLRNTWHVLFYLHTQNFRIIAHLFFMYITKRLNSQVTGHVCWSPVLVYQYFSFLS